MDRAGGVRRTSGARRMASVEISPTREDFTVFGALVRFIGRPFLFCFVRIFAIPIPVANRESPVVKNLCKKNYFFL
jgi:hypothetical protein